MKNICHLAPLDFRSATASGGNNTGPNCVQVAFAKASASAGNGACVEVGYVKADPCTSVTNCVEVGATAACTDADCNAPGVQPGDIAVRDSKGGEGSPVIAFGGQAWREYVAGVLAGHSDRDGADYVIRDPRGTGIVLRFTADEWAAFQDGCAKNEFTYDLAAV